MGPRDESLPRLVCTAALGTFRPIIGGLEGKTNAFHLSLLFLCNGPSSVVSALTFYFISIAFILIKLTDIPVK